MLGAAGDLAEVVVLRADLHGLIRSCASVARQSNGSACLRIVSFFVVDELLKLLQW